MNSYTFKGMDLKLGILDVNKKVDIMSKLQSTEKLVFKIKNLIKTYYILQSFVGCNHSFGSGENLLYANSEKKRIVLQTIGFLEPL